MLRAPYRFAAIASMSLATLFTIVSDVSAGHRHRRAKSNDACCCPIPVVTASPCATGCSGGYSGSSSVGYPGSYYPNSGQMTVSNGNYSTYGSSTYYPSAGYQSGNYSGYQGGTYYSSPINGNGYGSNNYGGSVNSNVQAGANVGAAVGQAVGGNTGANVGAAIGAAAGAR